MKILYKDKNNKTKIINKKFKNLKLNKNESLIEIYKVGICKTDIYVSNNIIKKNNIILGHECYGKVIKSNNKKLLNKIVSINPLYKNKFLGVDKNGCFQKYIKLPNKQLYITSFKNDLLNVYTEPVAASLSFLNSSNINKNMKGIIFGNKNNRITKLVYLLMKKLNYNVCIYNKKYKNKKYDYVIDTNLNQENFNIMVTLLKNKGILLLRSRYPYKIKVNFNELIKKEIIIENSYYYSFNKTIKIMKKYEKELLKFISKKEYKLKQWKTIFNKSLDSNKKLIIKIKKVIKV